MTRAVNGLPVNSIDSHVHFWDPGRPDWYPYLAPQFDMSNVGVSFGRDMRQVYDLDDHLANTGPCGVTTTVHINATGAPEAFLPEMERLSAIAEAAPAIGAIQGKVDLTAAPERIVALLEEYERFPLFRGVRLLRVPDFAAVEVRTVLDWLTEHGRTLDLGVHPHEMAGAVAVLGSYPALDVVVEHAGWPLPADLDDDRRWLAGMSALAELGPQVRCKISGLAMALDSIDPERLRPWIRRPLELFGSDRCMFGSNFPVDRAVTGYADLLEAYLTVLAEAGPGAVEDVFVHTAARFYDLPVPGRSDRARNSEV